MFPPRMKIGRGLGEGVQGTRERSQGAPRAVEGSGDPGGHECNCMEERRCRQVVFPRRSWAAPRSPWQLKAGAASVLQARAIYCIARADNNVYSFNAIVSLILSKILSTCHKMINGACFHTNENFPQRTLVPFHIRGGYSKEVTIFIWKSL